MRATTKVGTTSTQLNVRAEPTTTSAVLGIINPGDKVQIIAKDASGNWYEIAYPTGTSAIGWVTTQYVDVKDKGNIPLAGGASTGSSVSGVVKEQVNVRSEPGTEFKSIGTLNPKDVILVTGKDEGGLWLQIQYPPGATSIGWITAAYVQSNGVDSLPIVPSSRKVIGTSTPTGIPLSITPTVIAAPIDNDSAQTPAVNLTFSPSGARALIYTSDVSTPPGDSADWIQFIPYGAMVSINLTCTGNGLLNLEVVQNGNLSNHEKDTICGQTALLPVTKGKPTLLRIDIGPNEGEMKYVRYTLRIETVLP